MPLGEAVSAVLGLDVSLAEIFVVLIVVGGGAYTFDKVLDAIEKAKK